MKRIIFILAIAILAHFTPMQAQLLGRLKQAAMDKIERKVEDKIVDELSERIANAAVRPINAAIDEMFKEQYKETYGKEYEQDSTLTPEERAAMMTNIMSALYGNTDLPESYTFDYNLTIEIKDYGEKKSQMMKMLIANDGKSFGMEQPEDNNKSVIVFDMERDLMVIYNEKDKTVMAMSNVMKMAGRMTSNMVESNAEEIELKKSNKTKKILGYTAVKYDFETAENTGEAHVGQDMPFTWEGSFGKMMEYFSPHFKEKSGRSEMAHGFLLESINKRKSDKKESSWEVKSIDNKQFSIKNSQYKNALAGVNAK